MRQGTPPIKKARGEKSLLPWNSWRSISKFHSGNCAGVSAVSCGIITIRPRARTTLIWRMPIHFSDVLRMIMGKFEILRR